MIPATTERVAKHTSSDVNRRIRRQTEERVASYAKAGPEMIGRRLKELDEEWDIERALETNGSTLLLLGLALGTFVHRRFLFLPAFVGAFCLQHALQGWCPPIEAFRRMGIRTSREIEEERIALMSLRGDFKTVRPESAQQALEAARAA